MKWMKVHLPTVLIIFLLLFRPVFFFLEFSTPTTYIITLSIAAFNETEM